MKGDPQNKINVKFTHLKKLYVVNDIKHWCNNSCICCLWRVSVCVCLHVCASVYVCVCMYLCLFVSVLNISTFSHIQICIQSGKLQTAAKYLIIIQNLETPIVGKQVSATVLSSSFHVCTYLFFNLFVFSWPPGCWRLH